MNTPICDFARAYAARSPLRCHMPGHKGSGPLGIEALDLTEIGGADSLYEADGIIAESEEYASRLFGCPTFYSTEGSSQCIRAMVQLAALHSKARGRQPRIAAGRNAHKTFLTAAALLDVAVDWLCPQGQTSWLSCHVDEVTAEQALRRGATALYVTSPDYLGNVAPIARLSRVCREYGALLLVDGAHGAYLRFLPESAHPMDLGADLCCGSAHKTLPVLTGGAYLHVRDRELAAMAKEALALFGSTSPSYVILQSLDAANPYLAELPGILAEFLPEAERLRRELEAVGYTLCGDEPLKITVRTKGSGYLGTELAELLLRWDAVCEFADPDHLVLMIAPGMDLDRIRQALTAVPRKAPITAAPPEFIWGEQVMSIRAAALSPWERLPVEQCLGRVLAAPSVGCPPAVPIAVCGERLERQSLECMRYYGITECVVVK